VIYFSIFILFSVLSYPQDLAVIEKLKAELKVEKSDTAKIAGLLKLSNKLYKASPNESMKYSFEALRMAKKINRSDLQIKALNKLGDGFWFQTDYNNAYSYYYQAYQISDSIQDEKSVSVSLYNLGWLSCIQQHNFKDISYLYKSLQISLKNKDDFMVMQDYNALGTSYTEMFGVTKLKSHFDSSVLYLKRGLDFARNIKYYKSVPTFNVNLGDLFFNAKDFKSSQFYYNNAFDLYRANGDSINTKYSLFKCGKCDFELGDLKKALMICELSYDYFKKREFHEYEVESLLSLAKIYYKMGDYKKAYDFYELYVKGQLELDKKSMTISLSSIENKHSLDKSEASVLQLTQAKEIQELKNKRKTIYISLLISVGIVIVIIAYLLFRQNKIKQESNSQLTEQNKIIREKKEEIEQSIQYAKGIQTSFLPDVELLDIFLPNNFIFYQPKDVVSGDFYWFQTSKDKKQILLACADCTGHGVPGALMSMVGINMLQQFCGIEKLHRPSTILKNLNNEIKNSLKQNSDQNKQRDGMDIALIRLDLNESKMVYSAANRSLYILRNKEVLELKPTKSAIGGYTQFDQIFEEQEFTLHKGDLIIMTTDGFADQFGGAEGKKYMTKKFKDLLISVNGLSSKDQHAAIQSAFNTWKGNYDQVDDVCVVGINV
jgi:serine phosphatase RsbU (regulator of sigma subunit)